MVSYPPNKEIINELQQIINQSDDKQLNPKTLYRNIFNSSGTSEKLSLIFEVPQSLTQKIINIKALQRDMTVPNEIKRQLLYLDRNAVMCWGSHNFIGSGAIDPFHNGELIFSIINVKGIVKGYIKIQLNYSDTYDIYIFDTMESTEPKYEIKSIYCDQLIEVIGDKIGY